MSNRLAMETSPYLQQHAENPVDWFPCGPEALERARCRGRNRRLVRSTMRQFLPFAVIAQVGQTEESTWLPWMANRSDVQTPTAYLCHRGTCQLPQQDPAAWAEQLRTL